MQTIPLKKFSTPFSQVSSIFSHWYERLRANQFIRLVQHFVRRAFSSGLGSETGAWHLGLGGILGLLSIPGAFASLLLLDKYSTLRWLVLDHPRLSLHELMLPDRYFFIVLSTVATGLVVVVRWDGLLPDRQDFANLAPLPISYGRIFGANLVALLCVACLVGLAVNVFSAILFPLLVATAMDVSFFHLLSIHAISVFAASLFAFFFCTGAMSVPMAILPVPAWNRFSIYLRIVMLVGLVATLAQTFSVMGLLSAIRTNQPSLFQLLPPVWFLAMSESPHALGDGAWARLNATAQLACPATFAITVATCLISYRRHYIRVPETVNLGLARSPVLNRSLSQMAAISLRSPFHRACYQFAGLTVLRSGPHSFIVGAATCIGLLTASQALMQSGINHHLASEPFSGGGLITAPLILLFALITGLRASFEIPSILRANWILRTTSMTAQNAVSVARTLILTFVFAAILLPSFAIYALVWGIYVALSTFTIFLGLSALLVETVLLTFRKVPFACSLPEWKNSSILVLFCYFAGFFIFVNLGQLAFRASRGLIGLVCFALVVVIAFVSLARLRAWINEDTETLMFTESVLPVVSCLGISQDVQDN